MKVTLYHNKGCSTSNRVLDYLKDQHEDITIVDYLKADLSESKLKSLFDKVINKDLLIRRKEEVHGLIDYSLESTGAKARAVHQYPRLMERPIVELETEAMVARPFDEFVNWFNSKK